MQESTYEQGDGGHDNRGSPTRIALAWDPQWQRDQTVAAVGVGTRECTLRGQGFNVGGAFPRAGSCGLVDLRADPLDVTDLIVL